MKEKETAARMDTSDAGDRYRIAGIVLAGGQSTRMGQDKALLPYRGGRLVDWMASLLRASGVVDVHVSVPADRSYPGHRCVADTAADAGPVGGILSVVAALTGYRGFLVVPVDMPLLTPGMLGRLTQPDGTCYYAGTPLPAFLANTPALHSHPPGGSVKGLLAALAARPVPPSPGDRDRLVNVNTEQDWIRIQTAEEASSR